MAKVKVKAKKKTCKAGWQCGKGCISRKKTCRKNIKNPQGKFVAQTYAQYVESLQEGGGGSAAGGQSTPEPKPKTEKPLTGEELEDEYLDFFLDTITNKNPSVPTTKGPEAKVTKLGPTEDEEDDGYLDLLGNLGALS